MCFVNFVFIKWLRPTYASKKKRNMCPKFTQHVTDGPELIYHAQERISTKCHEVFFFDMLLLSLSLSLPFFLTINTSQFAPHASMPLLRTCARQPSGFSPSFPRSSPISPSFLPFLPGDLAVFAFCCNPSAAAAPRYVDTMHGVSQKSEIIVLCQHSSLLSLLFRRVVHCYYPYWLRSWPH